VYIMRGRPSARSASPWSREWGFCRQREREGEERERERERGRTEEEDEGKGQGEGDECTSESARAGWELGSLR
jgi:hypothetical protein